MRAVKHTKIVLLMVVPALILLLLGGSARPPAAQAKVTKILTITNVMCLTLAGNVDWNGNGALDDTDGAGGLQVCQSPGLGQEANFRVLTRVLERISSGDDTSNPKPEDFAKVDMDAGQVHQDDGLMYVVAFVGNDDPVGFFADRGVFNNDLSSITCGPASDPMADFADEDCDGDGVKGDGVVVAPFQPNGADRGPAEFRVRQNHIEMSEPYKIVGEPHHITLKAMDTAIQDGAPVCELMSDVPTFIAISGAPETAVLVATVTDSDGTPITGGLVGWSVDDSDKRKASLVIPASLEVPFSPSLDLQALGLGAPETLCGGDETGTVKITAKLTDGSAELPSGLALDPGRTPRQATIELPVQSAPEKMELSASPAGLVCDGASTSTVTATLTDADGKPVVNGNHVEFSVKALGVASPIDGVSATGVATSVVTPLAGLINGVVVHATWMRHVVKGGEIPATPEPPDLPEPVPLKYVASDLEQTLLVNCEQAAPAAPEAPPAALPGGAPAGTVISPPRTGDGGSHAPSAWLALPLGAAALLLMGSGFALRRRLR